MKKLNILALCAVLAPAYMLGISNVVAEERDKSCETHQHAGETVSEDKEAEGDGTTSAPTAENGEEGDTSGVQDYETQEPGDTDQSDGSGDTEATAEGDRHCGDVSAN